MIQLANFRSDKELITAIQLGGAQKERAITFLIQRYGGYMLKVQKKLRLSVEDTQDAYTDAVVALGRQIESGGFRGESKLSTFFYRIFYNKGVDLVRKNTTKRVEPVYDIPQIEDPAKDMLSLLAIQDEMKQLKGYLAKIGEPCQQILLDWGFWGYKMGEIAERVGLKDADQAKRRKFKCLQKLMKVVEVTRASGLNQ